MAPQGADRAFVVPVLGQGWSIVVGRHAPDWWALTADERQAVLELLDQMRVEHDAPLPRWRVLRMTAKVAPFISSCGAPCFSGA
jgi:hypothetical protein